MKYAIPLLTSLLCIYGLFIIYLVMLFGEVVYTPFLILATFIGLGLFFIRRKTGSIIILIASIAWLFFYAERASFLFLYDRQNMGRWIFVGIPIVLAALLFILLYKSRQDSLAKPFQMKFAAFAILSILSLGFLTFARKTHTNEFNCWYFFEPDQKEFKITLAITPEHLLTTTSHSPELKALVLKYGLRYEGREGIYCPETKINVVTRFKKITAVAISGFRNSNTNYEAILPEPVELDLANLNGDKTTLEPRFSIGY